MKVIVTPIRAPRPNAFAERWVRTVRTECLDWTIVFGRRRLERIQGRMPPTTTAEGHIAARPGDAAATGLIRIRGPRAQVSEGGMCSVA